MYGFAKDWKRVDVQDRSASDHCGAAVMLYFLRKKSGEGYVETVVGSGYRFVG